MLVPPLARISTPRFGAVPSYRLVWVVPSYSRVASGTAWSADGREAYPSPYEGTANDVITARLFRWNTADRRAFHLPASPGTMRRNPVNRHAPAIDPQERVEEPPLR
jgi:hypothetical protein